MTSEAHVNFFDLFGVPTAFAVDAGRLDRAYRELQSRVHPDRHAASGPTEQRLAAQWAMLANEAYHTLKDTIARACHLLQLRGIDALSPAGAPMPTAFLVEQMEWRERIDDARALRSFAALEGLNGALAEAVDALERELADLLDRVHDYPQAAGTVGKLRFLARLREEVDLALDAVAEDTAETASTRAACAPPA